MQTTTTMVARWRWWCRRWLHCGRGGDAGEGGRGWGGGRRPHKDRAFHANAPIHRYEVYILYRTYMQTQYSLYRHTCSENFMQSEHFFVFSIITKTKDGENQHL